MVATGSANEVAERFFRHEHGRLTARLLRVIGPAHADLVEDIVQEALVRALSTWRIRGVPDNPSAWLLTVARNRAYDVLRREKVARRFAPELAEVLEGARAERNDFDKLFSAGPIADDLLRTMFSCCHPQIAEPGQVALILRTLCGFGPAEIANALLCGAAAIEKRLGRARAVLRQSGELYEVRSEVAIARRLPAVQRAIYLLFNEGYHASHPDRAVRKDLCAEAIRLALLLLDLEATATPATHALLALMFLGMARIDGRVDDSGALLFLEEQDRDKWDRRFMMEGYRYLSKAAQGDAITAYHIEAGIAAAHCTAQSVETTDWPAIVHAYDTLYRVRHNPVVGLNRIIALSYAAGPDEGLRALGELEGRKKLANYPFLPAAAADMHRRAGRLGKAAELYADAAELARTSAERNLLLRRLGECAS